MVEFSFITNDANSTTYDGPSGIRYVIYLQKPFIVDNDEDIEFFRKNKGRFEEIGIIKKIEEIIKPPEPKKTDDELFTEEINELKVSKKTKKEILKAYMIRKDFVEDLEDGYKLSPHISKKDMDKIKFHFLKFDNISTIKKNIKKSRKKR